MALQSQSSARRVFRLSVIGPGRTTTLSLPERPVQPMPSSTCFCRAKDVVPATQRAYCFRTPQTSGAPASAFPCGVQCLPEWTSAQAVDLRAHLLAADPSRPVRLSGAPPGAPPVPRQSAAVPDEATCGSVARGLAILKHFLHPFRHQLRPAQLLFVGDP